MFEKDEKIKKEIKKLKSKKVKTVTKYEMKKNIKSKEKSRKKI